MGFVVRLNQVDLSYKTLFANRDVVPFMSNWIPKMVVMAFGHFLEVFGPLTNDGSRTFRLGHIVHGPFLEIFRCIFTHFSNGFRIVSSF